MVCPGCSVRLSPFPRADGSALARVLLEVTLAPAHQLRVALGRESAQSVRRRKVDPGQRFGIHLLADLAEQHPRDLEEGLATAECHRLERTDEAPATADAELHREIHVTWVDA